MLPGIFVRFIIFLNLVQSKSNVMTKRNFIFLIFIFSGIISFAQKENSEAKPQFYLNISSGIWSSELIELNQHLLKNDYRKMNPMFMAGSAGFLVTDKSGRFFTKLNYATMYSESAYLKNQAWMEAYILSADWAYKIIHNYKGKIKKNPGLDISDIGFSLYPFIGFDISDYTLGLYQRDSLNADLINLTGEKTFSSNTCVSAELGFGMEYGLNLSKLDLLFGMNIGYAYSFNSINWFDIIGEKANYLNSDRMKGFRLEVSTSFKFW